LPGHKAPEDERREAILCAAFAVAAEERLTGLTIRRVAAEAGVSSGLVFFHFESRDALLVALLDWLLARTIVAGEVHSLASRVGGPAERMLATVRRDIERLARHRARVELFFDYWVLGTRHPMIRAKIRGALGRYRDAFRPLAAAIVESDPERYAGVTAADLAAVVAGFVEGCAVQAVMDPPRFDVERYMTTLRSLVARPVAAGGPHGALTWR
jgi:AcrR family transcriptional regulator